MRELFKKVGSLALGTAALSLVLVNAAMTHGCARSPATQSTEPLVPPNAATTASADPCQPPAYMYATKAPIWIPPECRGGAPAPAKVEEPSSPDNAARQAP